MNLLVVALALPVGMLIGAVGVGGVLLPPALVHLGGLDVHTAAGTSIWCFLFTGVLGTIAYAKQGVPWRFVGWLTLGIVPGALAGAVVNGVLSATVLNLILALVTLGSGAYNLVGPAPKADRDELPAMPAVTVGAVIGFGSALTGTGGPVLLVPVLLMLGVAALPTVAAGVVIQLPLVISATVGYVTHDAVDFGLGSVLGVCAGVGTMLGAYVALKLSETVLRKIVSTALLLVGVFLLVEVLF